jgi:hypothetical protein
MSNQPKSYDDMSYNELLFLLIYHLMKENAHEDKYNYHKDRAKLIVRILNTRDDNNLYKNFINPDND